MRTQKFPYYRTWRAVYFLSMFVASFTTLWLFATRFVTVDSLTIARHGEEEMHNNEHQNAVGTGSELANFALQKVLDDASPIFGNYQFSDIDTARWMAAFPDSTPLVRMNIPGTHDAATWNYSIERKEQLDPIKRIYTSDDSPADFYRCQDRSLLNMLDQGIRAFDLRYAYDVTNVSLVFWHGSGLQSETATVDDVMFGFYQWLEDHPSEALLLSFQHEHHDESSREQQLLYNALTSLAAKHYIHQEHGSLGTLGSVRGKIVLLKRFDLTKLPPSYSDDLPGLHLSPSKWTVNGADIHLVYNEDTGATAYIEDYYSPRVPKDSLPVVNIKDKYDATSAALQRAASNDHPDSLYWSFASSTNTGTLPPKTPRIQALGNGSQTPDGGVNNMLVPFLKGMEGKRLGIIMFDFFEQPSNLMETFLGLLKPSDFS